MSKSINLGLLLTALTVSHLSRRVVEGQTPENADGQDSQELTANEVAVIRQDVVEKIKRYRIHHDLPGLKVLDDAQQFAQAWADKTIKSRKWGASHNPQNTLYGETIGFYSSLRHVGEVAVDIWYYQLRFFEGSKTNTAYMEDAIQMLWKKTTHVGVGVAGSHGGKVCIIVNYFPPGNSTYLYESNLPNITADDVAVATSKWKRIRDQLYPGNNPLFWRPITNPFPYGLLPGWASTIYPD